MSTSAPSLMSKPGDSDAKAGGPGRGDRGGSASNAKGPNGHPPSPKPPSPKGK